MIALCIFVLIGMLGLAMDVGRLFIVKNEVQAFADASALAAIRSMDGTQAGIQTANTVALAGPLGSTQPNAYDFGTKTVSTITPSYATSFSGTYDSYATASAASANTYRFLKVTASADLPIYFLRVINGVPAQMTVTASATAGQKPQASLSNGGLVPFAPDAHNAADTKNFGLTPGSRYTLKWGNGNSTNCPGDSGFNPSLAPSEHGFVDIGQGNGNSAIRDSIINGGYPNSSSSPSSVTVGTVLGGVPGNRGTSIFGALSTRAAQDTDQTSTTWATYAGNGRRVITAPIANPATWSGNGSNAQVTIAGFGNFLLDPSYSGNSGPICAIYIGPGNLNGNSSGATDGTKVYSNYLYR